MQSDTRTSAEIAYDATRLSRTPASQGPFGTDVTDELIATFERLEAAHPDATPQQILAMADEEAIIGWIVDMAEERRAKERAHAHGTAAAQFTFLLDTLDDARANDLAALIASALALDPATRVQLVDSMLTS